MQSSSLPRVIASSKETVSYFYNETSAKYHYGDGHYMKPARLALAHNLIVGYGLHRHMETYTQRRATEDEMTDFHAEDYIEFLKRVTPDNVKYFSKFLERFNLGSEDCPVFEGMFDLCRLSSGGSIEGARRICGRSDIAINWAGGLHHAKKFEASGFCYVNDIVLGILQLLRIYPRVVYIDIDVHHGDGVQEAFYQTNRVMTVSFHRYDGAFFPGTGSLDEVGLKSGRNYTVNVPLQPFIDDESYAHIFRSVISNVMRTFQPSAIVLQCGADSLAGDRIGTFNLSVKGHGACVDFMKTFKVPMLVLGGGGYTIRNVARAWTYETSVCVGVDVPDELPVNDYYQHFGPDYRLHSQLVDPRQQNLNSREYLDQLSAHIAEQLRYVAGAPSVQMQEIPPDLNGSDRDMDWEVDEAEDKHPDVRPEGHDAVGKDGRSRRREKEPGVMNGMELFESESDQDHDPVAP
ncbi:putative histone deacetylase HDAC3 protein [Zopfochytrium polystomum]|nr:putative histone deacetylase HDAC3 protein [Zopfochytrium polystomum]